MDDDVDDDVDDGVDAPMGSAAGQSLASASARAAATTAAASRKIAMPFPSPPTARFKIQRAATRGFEPATNASVVSRSWARNASVSPGSANPTGATRSPPSTARRLATSLCLCVTATVFGKWFTSAPGGRSSYRAPVVKLMLHRSDVSAGSLVRIHPLRAVNIRDRSDASGFAPSCCCALCNANRRGGGVSTLRFVESTDDESTFLVGRA